MENLTFGNKAWNSFIDYIYYKHIEKLCSNILKIYKITFKSTNFLLLFPKYI